MKKHFLIVDDDEDDRFLFREALREVDPGLVCKEAHNGREAIEMLKAAGNALPAVIFLDINMPVMNGWEFMEKLRQDEQFSRIPVIFYSTSSMEPDIKRALAMGALCFCVKVDEYEKLKSLLDVVTCNYDKDLCSALEQHPVGSSCHVKRA